MISVSDFRQSSLFMNALYLMLSTFAVAISGYIFWVLIAHTYNTTAVGLATTLLSASSLLSLLGLTGFDTTFVRFLPGSDRKNQYMNSGFILVALLSATLAICFAVGLPLVSPRLSIVGGFWPFISFTFFTVITSLNTLTNAVFLAFKQARYIFLISTAASIGKMLLPLIPIHGDAMAIFNLAGIVQLLGLGLSIIWMVRTCGYSFSPSIDISALRVVRKFSFSVYAASVLNLLPPTLLPLLIIHQIGPKDAAYYYMAFTIAGVLYTIAYASMQSAFAESSHDEQAMRAYLVKAIKLIAILLFPAAFLVAIISGMLLTTFGHEYAQGARTLLQLFALSALPVAMYSALGAIFKVTKNLRGVICMNIGYAAVILGFSYLLLPRWGLIAVGWGWAIGNIVACGIGTLFLIKNNNNTRLRS